MQLGVGEISIILTIMVQVVAAAYAYGKLKQRLDSQERKLEKFMEEQKAHRLGVQDSIEIIWQSMSKRFENIFNDYLKTEDADRFFKKRGDK